MGLSEQIAAIKSLNFEEIVGDAIEAQQENLLDYQKSQMINGYSGDGGEIGKYANDQYAAKKHRMNPLAGYGNVDLKLTGEFQRNIKARFFSDGFTIFSTDQKMEDLVFKYGPRIFGLNADFINYFAEDHLNTEINKRIQNKIIHGL